MFNDEAGAAGMAKTPLPATPLIVVVAAAAAAAAAATAAAPEGGLFTTILSPKLSLDVSALVVAVGFVTDATENSGKPDSFDGDGMARST